MQSIHKNATKSFYSLGRVLARRRNRTHLEDASRFFIISGLMIMGHGMRYPISGCHTARVTRVCYNELVLRYQSHHLCDVERSHKDHMAKYREAFGIVSVQSTAGQQLFCIIQLWKR